MNKELTLKDDLTTFLLSSGLIGMSFMMSMSPYILIAGIAGCGLSAWNVIDGMVHKKEEVIFENCGLINKDKVTPKQIKQIKSDDKIQKIYSIPKGLNFDDFKKETSSLSTAFKMPLNVKLNDNYTITLESVLNVYFKDFEPLDLKPYQLLLGENLVVDMNKFPHLLLGGDTGTGKSRVLFTILTQMVSKNENIDIHLLQVRKNDLGVFKNCKQVKTFSKTLDDVLDCLIALDIELQRRERLIDNFRGIYNIEDYSKKHKANPLNYCFVFIDEFSFLNVSQGDTKEEKALKRQCLKYIKSVVNVGRSSGVFLITSLQKPTADSIPSDIKGEMITRVSMRIQDAPVSIVVLGTDEATKLQDRQMIVKTNKSEYGYSYTIEHNDIVKCIKDSVIERPTHTVKKIEHKPTKEENTDGKIPLL